MAFVIESRDEWISASGITIDVCEAVVMWTIMFTRRVTLTIFSLKTNNISAGQTDKESPWGGNHIIASI